MNKCPSCGQDYQTEDFQSQMLMMGLDICRSCLKSMTNEHGDIVIEMQGIKEDATDQQHED